MDSTCSTQVFLRVLWKFFDPNGSLLWVDGGLEGNSSRPTNPSTTLRTGIGRNQLEFYSNARRHVLLLFYGGEAGIRTRGRDFVSTTV